MSRASDSPHSPQRDRELCACLACPARPLASTRSIFVTEKYRSFMGPFDVDRYRLCAGAGNVTRAGRGNAIPADRD